MYLNKHFCWKPARPLHSSSWQWYSPSSGEKAIVSYEGISAFSNFLRAAAGGAESPLSPGFPKTVVPLPITALPIPPGEKSSMPSKNASGAPLYRVGYSPLSSGSAPLASKPAISKMSVYCGWLPPIRSEWASRS